MFSLLFYYISTSFNENDVHHQVFVHGI